MRHVARAWFYRGRRVQRVYPMSAPQHNPLVSGPETHTRPGPGALREKLWRIIFLSDTPAGRAFDIVLLWLIGLSVLLVMIESVESLHLAHGRGLRIAEWVFTAVFTVEYIVRLLIVRRPLRYARSFFGVVDLLSIAPTYLELVLADSHYFMTLRVLRMLRMFRVLKMAHHLGEARVLLDALQAARAKITVFLFSVLSIVCVEGTIMYVIEHSVNEGFRSIPQAIYWAIVTLTTVGYGDVIPVTAAGKVMASVVMLTGFAIIAVPTGIVAAELGHRIESRQNRRRCEECGATGHAAQARHCHHCGAALP